MTSINQALKKCKSVDELNELVGHLTVDIGVIGGRRVRDNSTTARLSGSASINQIVNCFKKLAANEGAAVYAPKFEAIVKKIKELDHRSTELLEKQNRILKKIIDFRRSLGKRFDREEFNLATFRVVDESIPIYAHQWYAKLSKDEKLALKRFYPETFDMIRLFIFMKDKGANCVPAFHSVLAEEQAKYQMKEKSREVDKNDIEMEEMNVEVNQTNLKMTKKELEIRNKIYDKLCVFWEDIDEVVPLALKHLRNLA